MISRRSHARSRHVMAVTSTLLVVAAALLSPTGSASAEVASGQGARYERAVVAKINKVRAARGIAPVHVVACPDQVATAQARRMRRTHRLSRVAETTLVKECNRPLELQRAAITSTAPTALVASWLAQRGSRKVLLDRRVRWVGVGAKADRTGRWHVSLLLVGKRAHSAGSVPNEEAAPTGADAPEEELDELQVRIFNATNRRREAHDLPPLSASPCATGFAEQHSAWMVENTTLAHADLTDLRQRCAAAGVAENVAYFSGGDLDAATVLKAWMGSPAHRANILNPDLTHLGVGVGRTRAGAWYLTQDFLRVG